MITNLFRAAAAVGLVAVSATAHQARGDGDTVSRLAPATDLTECLEQGNTGPCQSDIDAINNAVGLLDRGRQAFRYDTFGSEDFWGGQLRLHDAIRGGVGGGLTPRAALDLGLKVDLDRLPDALVAALQDGEVDLEDPANTLALLRENAVVGLTGFFDEGGNLTSVGIQCALCHATVDDTAAPGIGYVRDGWANRDLNVGAIIALAPDLTPFASLLGVDQQTVRDVMNSWGPGKFDAELVLDGKAFTPDGQPAATLIPPAYGLAGVNLHTWTGWGSVPHWNALVGVLEMGGHGTLYDPRLADASQFPVAAQAGFDDVRPAEGQEDRVTPLLSALHFYQLALPAPEPPPGSFDPEAASRGETLFNDEAQCATCHVPPLYTEPGYNLHTPEEIGIDDFQANRSPARGYRTSPLAGLWAHAKGGFYHDGRFADLEAVVDHYDDFLGLGLSDAEKSDLVEFLKSI